MRMAILGKSGRGKSWFAGYVIGEAARRFEYACHFDIEDEERGFSGEDDSLMRTLYIDEEYYNGCDVDALKQAFGKYQRLRVVPDGLTDDEQIDLLGMVCDAAMQLTKGNDRGFWLSVDEAHVLCPTNQLDDRISRLVTGGRKREVEWMFISQRPAKVSEDILTQTTESVYFQLTKDSDLNKVDASCGFNADPKLRELTKREAIHEDEDSGETQKVNTEDLDRRYPHYASDDGRADDIMEFEDED